MCVTDSPLKQRCNKANSSLDGADGSAIDIPVGAGPEVVPDTKASVPGSEDVVFDTQIYDYVLPTATDVEALRIAKAPG